MKKDGMLAAVALAAGQADEPGEKFEVTAQTIAAHFPAVAVALRDEGAVAERKRIAGIEEALLPGYEGIIAAHKADGAKTAADAALAVIAAEKAAGKNRAKALDDDEAKLKGLKSTAAENAGDEGEEPKIDPKAVSVKAKAYIAKQAEKGVTVNAEDAVNHILKKGE